MTLPYILDNIYYVELYHFSSALPVESRQSLNLNDHSLCLAAPPEHVQPRGEGHWGEGGGGPGNSCSLGFAAYSTVSYPGRVPARLIPFWINMERERNGISLHEATIKAWKMRYLRGRKQLYSRVGGGALCLDIIFQL